MNELMDEFPISFFFKGHSQKGCIAYTGIDMDTGQLLYITEWNIKYSQIEQYPCNGVGKGCCCYWCPMTTTTTTNDSSNSCTGTHHVDDVIAAIERHVSNLSQLHHRNLIQYECVLCIKRKEGLIVYLVQDFVLGMSLSNISSSSSSSLLGGGGWSMDGVRNVAKSILEALIYLHNKGVSHNYLRDSNVFLDNMGIIRCADFSLIRNLYELIGVQSSNHPSRRGGGDLPALGTLIENLMTTPHTFEMQDFIEK